MLSHPIKVEAPPICWGVCGCPAPLLSSILTCWNSLLPPGKGSASSSFHLLPLLGSGSLHVSHALRGAVIYPHGSALGAREGLSQLHYGPSALKIAFICLLTLSLWLLKMLQLQRSPKDADERALVILHTGMLSRSCF